MRYFWLLAALLTATEAAATDWTPVPGDGMVGFSARSRINEATLDGGCNRRLGPGLTFTLRDYSGGGLQRVDDASEPVFVDVAAGGRVVGSKVAMHYFAPEKAWVLSGMLPASFLDTLARGDTMTLRSARGEPVAEFGLTGTAKLRAAMRAGCGF
jgi:hypothetical protein